MRITRILAAVAVCLFMSVSARARFMMPEPAPIDRVIASGERYLKEHPDDPEAVYALARAHYLAYTLKSLAIPVYGYRGEFQQDDKKNDTPAKLIRTAPAEHLMGAEWFERSARDAKAREMALQSLGLKQGEKIPDMKAYRDAVTQATEKIQKDNWQPPAPSQEQFDSHAQSALKLFTQLIAKKPDHALAIVGLACLQDEYAPRGTERELEPSGERNTKDIKMQVAVWHKAALANYARAFDLAVDKDAKIQHQPVAGVKSLVSHQAGEGYILLASTVPDLADKALVKKMREQLEDYKQLPMGAVTPIVFDLRNNVKQRDITSLWSTGQKVRFDLDGDRVVETRSWVSPGVSILVWDPMKSGKITSGRQLFGNVTWWLFWKDGFAAMASLDDDGDGQLTGPEMEGLAVWTDANGNAISEPGEVVPIDQTPIRSIAVKATSRLGDLHRSPLSPKGLILSDGSTRAVVDWITGN